MSETNKIFYGFLAIVALGFIVLGVTEFYKCDTVCETNRFNMEQQAKANETQRMLEQMKAKQDLLRAQQEYEKTPAYLEQKRIELEKHKATEARLAAEAEAREKTRIQDEHARAAKETADSVGYLETSRQVHD